MIKKDDKPLAVRVASNTRVGRGMGPRNGTGPRARAGLCSGPTAAGQIAACGR